MSTVDPTEDLRRELLDRGIPEAELADVIAHGGVTWDTEQLKAEFDVQGFLAPFVVARRKSDGKKGTLMFTHNPRFYFGFREED